MVLREDASFWTQFLIPPTGISRGTTQRNNYVFEVVTTWQQVTKSWWLQPPIKIIISTARSINCTYITKATYNIMIVLVMLELDVTCNRDTNI